MKKTWNNIVGMLALMLTATLTVTPATADKPEGKGKGHDRAEKSEHRQDKSRGDERDNRGSAGSAPRAGGYFVDQHRGHVRDYYGAEFQRGHCPPGLAKNNGCMPPGQAKKWEVGRPIPRDVVYYDLPQPLVMQIGVPPAGYRYVRAASDILLIAIGTGMVVDAIRDLGRI